MMGMPLVMMYVMPKMMEGMDKEQLAVRSKLLIGARPASQRAGERRARLTKPCKGNAKQRGLRATAAFSARLIDSYLSLPQPCRFSGDAKAAKHDGRR